MQVLGRAVYGRQPIFCSFIELSSAPNFHRQPITLLNVILQWCTWRRALTGLLGESVLGTHSELLPTTEHLKAVPAKTKPTAAPGVKSHKLEFYQDSMQRVSTWNQDPLPKPSTTLMKKPNACCVFAFISSWRSTNPSNLFPYQLKSSDNMHPYGTTESFELKGTFKCHLIQLPWRHANIKTIQRGAKVMRIKF